MVNKQAVVPFNVQQIEKKFGILAADLMSIDSIRKKYPRDYINIPGETPEEKHLSFMHNRIGALADTIDIQKLEIGFLVSMGNLMGLARVADLGSMEEYLLTTKAISSTLLNESKRYYDAWLAVQEYGFTREQISNASATQIEAIKRESDEIRRQRKEAMENRAQKEGVSEFRKLPQEKKEVIAKLVEEECGEKIREGVNFILNTEPEAAHQVVSANGGKPNRPFILCVDVRLDASTGRLSGKFECYIENDQITPFKKNNTTWAFVLADGSQEKLSPEELGNWIAEALL